MLKDRQNDKIEVLEMSLQGLTDHRSGSRTPANKKAPCFDGVLRFLFINGFLRKL